MPENQPVPMDIDKIRERLRNSPYTPRESGLATLLKRRDASMNDVEGVGTVLMIPGAPEQTWQHVNEYLADQKAAAGVLMSAAGDRQVGLVVDAALSLNICARLKIPFHDSMTRERYELELAERERGGNKESMTQTDLRAARAYVVRYNEIPGDALLMPAGIPQSAQNHLIRSGYSMGAFDEPGHAADGALIIKASMLEGFMERYGSCIEDLRQPVYDAQGLAALETERAEQRAR